jgi:hypothetical protein
MNWISYARCVCVVTIIPVGEFNTRYYINRA